MIGQLLAEGVIDTPWHAIKPSRAIFGRRGTSGHGRSAGVGRLMAGQVEPTAAESEQNTTEREPVGAVLYARMDDATLVAAAKQSPEAFGALYERHVRSVFAFCFSKLHDGHLAEDLTSQTFLQALRALPRYQERGTPIRGWLFRIAANLVTDRLRTQRPEQPLSEPPPGFDDAAPFEPADPKSETEITKWEQAEDFNRLIAGLSPEQQRVVRLRFVDGLPMADIGARMGRSEGAVKMLLMRALQNLRRRLGEEASHAG